MAGLGKSSNEETIYLGIAGGKVWRKLDDNGNKITKDHPDYREQEYEFSGETRVRSGAQYDNFTGTVFRVEIKDGNYGEQLLVGMIDDKGDSYTFSLGTNNRNSQNFFSALLVMDFSQPLHIRPYDFEGRDAETKKPNGKRVVGISFFQDGQKLDLSAVEGVPKADDELYKSGNRKQIKRFFEDLNDWYVEQVNMKVVPRLIENTPSKNNVSNTIIKQGVNDSEIIKKNKSEIPSKSTPNNEVKLTPIKMKKAIREYIDENYGEGFSLPSGVKGEELRRWYDLALEGEELPFQDFENDTQRAEVSSDDLKSQLINLLGQ